MTLFRLAVLPALMVVLPAVTALGEDPFLTRKALEPMSEAANPIDTGYRLLYDLKFAEARIRFTEWQELRPDDLLGEVSIAASYLFEEFYYQGVLSSEFFLDDKRLLGGIEGNPDEGRKIRFEDSNRRSLDLARRRVRENPKDADALFALMLATGMRADYASIIEKRQTDGLRLIREAKRYANQLLELRPDAADAWLALGMANYIIGCLPIRTRFFLWFGGISGDKELGMEQLEKTAEQGHYLRPFAKILLALAAIREKQLDLAHRELVDLVEEFPGNPLFARELGRLNR